MRSGGTKLTTPSAVNKRKTVSEPSCEELGDSWAGADQPNATTSVAVDWTTVVATVALTIP
jgi:hypothetical protein